MTIKPLRLDIENIPIAGQLYLPDAGPPYTAVVICHGVPSGRPHDPSDGGYPALAESICSEGFAALIFNFRGCGESGGNIDFAGWTRDLAAIIDHLSGMPEIEPYHIALLGFSGGAAVSIYTAAQDQRVSSVAACASPADFESFPDMADPVQIIDHFRSIGVIRDADFPPSAEEWFQSFDLITPIRYVRDIAPRPLLLVHGLKDETVDISHAYRLYSRAGEPKRLSIIDDAGHKLRRNEDAMLIVMDWLKWLYLEQAPESGYIDPQLNGGL